MKITNTANEPLPITGTLAANSGVDIGDVTLTAGTATVGGTTDAGPAWTSVLGVSNAVVSSADMSGAVVSITASPTSGQKLVVTDIVVSVDTAMRVDLKEETSGTIFFSFYLPANSGPAQITPRGKFKLVTADKKLQAITSAAGNVRITAMYYSEA